MWHVCVTYCVMSFQSGSSGRQKTLRRHFYLTVKTLLWLNKNGPICRLPDIWRLQNGLSSNQNIRIWDKFLSTLFKFRTKPRSTRSSSSEGILSDWVSGFGRQADVVWSCPLGFCDMWTLFEIILASFCDARWHYLTVSWHFPPDLRWISLCLTPSQKPVGFQKGNKICTKNLTTISFKLL